MVLAPAAGAYQPLVKAVDAAGNATELRTTLAVGAVGLPTVQKLRADSRARAVELKWDAVAENVDQYRIYVGEDEDDFAYTLETGKVTTKATIAGLVPGKVYYFAVTALKDELESREKSNVVSGQALGLGLTATE
ncbi:MAG TPA: fibronectin type III domain-containing protein, partial [Acidimicrobiales bacterium]|nr:fibronectin type III domain-containing protein [Acidimicrobiales bacterium]